MKRRRRHEQADIDSGDRVYPSKADLIRIEVGGDGYEVTADTVIN